MPWYELIGGIGFLLFFFASIAVAVIVLARLVEVIGAWARSRQAAAAGTPRRKRRPMSVLGCTRFSIVDTTQPRGDETGRRR